MATFAKLDENNIVTQIVKVGNDVPTSDGPLGENDMHVDGETYCTNLFGGRWKQCSATNAFRKQNAGIGKLMIVLRINLSNLNLFHLGV